jgi:hypothetical protein
MNKEVTLHRSLSLLEDAPFSVSRKEEKLFGLNSRALIEQTAVKTRSHLQTCLPTYVPTTKWPFGSLCIPLTPPADASLPSRLPY